MKIGPHSPAELAVHANVHIEGELHDAEIYAIRGDFAMSFGWGRENSPLSYKVWFPTHPNITRQARNPRMSRPLSEKQAGILRKRAE